MNGKAVSTQQLFTRSAAVVAACGVLGWAVATFLVKDAADRTSALIGIAVMIPSAFLSLWLKRHAVERGLQLALAAAVAIFFVRMIALTVAILLGMRAGLSPMAMVFGFFGEYFVLQVVEIRFVLAVHGRSGLAPQLGRLEGMS